MTMSTLHARAGVGLAQPRARLPSVPRQIARFCPSVRPAVAALAARDTRVADLAVSFPALLVAIALPRLYVDPRPVIAGVMAGASLAELAASARVPLWTRKLPPETFTSCLPRLPDGDMFRRQIANHLPKSARLFPVWLNAVAMGAEAGTEAFAVWVARENVRDPRCVDLHALRLLGLWSWYSAADRAGKHPRVRTPFVPSMKYHAASSAAYEWQQDIELHLNLGHSTIDALWHRPGEVRGYTFVPIRSAAEIAEEAAAMDNCLRSYGANVAHDWFRLWSVRRDGVRVATMSVRRHRSIVRVEDITGLRNADIGQELWNIAQEWASTHAEPMTDAKIKGWNETPFTQSAWTDMWKPYWLAKRRIPAWLPLVASRDALGNL
jgi:hypothetical protein